MTEEKINAISWRAALLGAAVGIAGPSYTGTLQFNLVLRSLLANGWSQPDAYAYLARYEFNLYTGLGLFLEFAFAILCGIVSAAYGQGKAVVQGLAAGVLASSFSVVMLLGPDPDTRPMLARLAGFGIPILGSLLGAQYFSQRKADSLQR